MALAKITVDDPVILLGDGARYGTGIGAKAVGYYIDLYTPGGELYQLLHDQMNNENDGKMEMTELVMKSDIRRMFELRFNSNQKPPTADMIQGALKHKFSKVPAVYSALL